jgi:hypothetical protein
MLIRDETGAAHVVALSGGHDSSALAFLLREQNPTVPYNYVFTPTGDELPAMFAFWRWLGEQLGRALVPIMETSLKAVVASEEILPNFKARYCTRMCKIEPYRRFLKREAAIGRVISHVGLRADEEGRAGGAYDDIEGVEMRFDLREQGIDEPGVFAILKRFGVDVPFRTDCARCYHQRIGEWYELWLYHRDIFMDAVADEIEKGGTYRTPGRDSWPTALIDLAAAFEAGRIPTISLDRMARERMSSGGCRVCSL